MTKNSPPCCLAAFLGLLVLASSATGQTNQNPLVRVITSGTLSERMRAYESIRATGETVRDPQVLPALLRELNRVDALQRSRLEGLSRGETVAPTEELGEYLFILLDTVCSYNDPRIVKPLLPFLGTGRRVIDSVARFGTSSVQQIADFVDSDQSDAINLAPALFTLRAIQRELLVGSAERDVIIRIAGQRLEGQQPAAVIEQALELAMSTGDVRLVGRVKELAGDGSQMRALVVGGPDDGSVVGYLQRKAQSLSVQK